MDQAEIAARIREAIRSLILDQWELAALDVGERTVTSHLFRHLADQFAQGRHPPWQRATRSPSTAKPRTMAGS